MHAPQWRLTALIFSLLVPRLAFADRCDEVQATIDAQATDTTPPPVLLRLGPHFSRRALPSLLALGRQGSLERRLAAYGAFGLARHADGLRQIVAAEPPQDAEGRLAYSLATLALGANTDTATIAATVERATVPRRRGAMWVLSRMKHVRPRQMLYEGLEDPDPEVRLTAAEALVVYRSRQAKNVLTALISSGTEEQRARAVEALIAVGHRFRTDELRRLDPDVAARALARAEARGASLGRLERAVAEKNPGVRAGRLAVAVSQRDSRVRWLARHCRRWGRRYGRLGKGERAMAGALLDEKGSGDKLLALEGDARTGALRVFAAFAAVPSASVRVDGSTAERIARAFEAWWPALSEPDRARAVEGLGAVDGATAVRFARRHLEKASGAALVAAAAVLRAHGTVDDALALVSRLDGPATLVYGPTLAAAARLCRLEAE